MVQRHRRRGGPSRELRRNPRSARVRAGNAITASAARRADSTPMPPQTTTNSSFSKKVNLRPWCSCCMLAHFLTSERTSRCSAAMMATLGIPVRSEPLYRTAQGILYWSDSPPQLAHGFIGTGPHFFLSHAYSFDGCARLAAQQAPGDGLVDQSCRDGKEVWEFHFRRGQARDHAELIQNLLQGEVLAAENVTLAALSLFKCRNVPASTFMNVDQI